LDAAEHGSEHWHEGEATQMLSATWYVVESLTAEGVPFDGKRCHAAIDKAHNTQDWGAYLYALKTYAYAAKDAYFDYRFSPLTHNKPSPVLLSYS
jgi:hypothetical protein